MYYHSSPERRSETSRNDRGIVVAVVQRTIPESWLPSVPDKPERKLLMNRVARLIVLVSYHDCPIKVPLENGLNSRSLDTLGP